MTRIATALATMLGVLVMGLPGGVCFALMGAGVEHHHHGEDFEAETTCLHTHDHGCHGHDHEDAPEEPCDPNAEGVEQLAQGQVLKIDPVAAPDENDFLPEWVATPVLAEPTLALQFEALPRSNAPPPPVTVRLCRFLI